jgi:hypothetical protein
MASMVGGWRNWRAVEGIWQLDRLAYVVIFLTRSLRAACAQPTRNLRANCVFGLFYTNSIFL